MHPAPLSVKIRNIHAFGVLPNFDWSPEIDEPVAGACGELGSDILLWVIHTVRRDQPLPNPA